MLVSGWPSVANIFDAKCYDRILIIYFAVASIAGLLFCATLSGIVSGSQNCYVTSLSSSRDPQCREWSDIPVERIHCHQT